MNRTLLLVTGAVVGSFVLPQVILACPFCQPRSGINLVNAGIFDQAFFVRVAAVSAPFPVLGGIVALIYYGPPRRGRRK